LSIPNLLTLFRIILTPAFLITLVSYSPEKAVMRYWAIGIYLAAVATDALDGILARVLKQKTELGQKLDPLADKILILSGFVGLLFVTSLPYKPPLWITVTIIFRDLVLLFGFFILDFMAVKFEVNPNWLGKMTTVFQMLLLFMVLIESPLTGLISYATVTFTIASGITYISKGLKLIQ
jgi:cardiolipin synthase